LALTSVLQEAKEKLAALIAEHGLGGRVIRIKTEQLSTEQAIGTPERQDFPLLEGKEVIVEAQLGDYAGHAFTSQPREFDGTVDEVLNIPLDTDSHRAIFVSSLNAVMAYLGQTTGTRHCRNDEPEKCGADMAANLKARFGEIKVGLVGLQPAILENLARTFGPGKVRCTDLNPKNIGGQKYGVEIWDGKAKTPVLIDWSNLLLVTSSTIVNNTFDAIRAEAIRNNKPLIVFGVSGSGIATLLGIERICPFGH
jgi:uncharacterized protein (DUF4213/DUF364 family)